MCTENMVDVGEGSGVSGLFCGGSAFIVMMDHLEV